MCWRASRWRVRRTRAGVVYSLAYGDQPALICELVDWARACGFRVIAAGKGTKYLPEYHASTPASVWGYYGLTEEQARIGGMNPQMFNSFLDGTKSGIEMAAVANATGLTPPPDGLAFPLCGTHELAEVLRPGNQGTLHHAGQVEVISSLHRDGRPVADDLRWGVYVVFEAPNDYTARCFKEYGVVTDKSGRITALYRPFHLIGLELNISILSAALRGEATGAPTAFRGDVVATAKRDLKAGEVLDGEGGACVWGKLLPANEQSADRRSADRAGEPGTAVARRVCRAVCHLGRCADRHDRCGLSLSPRWDELCARAKFTSPALRERSRRARVAGEGARAKCVALPAHEAVEFGRRNRRVEITEASPAP